MNSLKTILLAALAPLTLDMASASPPAAVGDSFFMQDGNGPFGLSNSTLIYLAKDGTCQQLFTRLNFDGNIVYDPSETGTYAYAPTPGNPAEATLTINLVGSSPREPGAATAYVLEFAGDTSGTDTNSGAAMEFSTFSFLLATPNTFLTNVSNRVVLRSNDTAVTGFVIQGTASRLVLVRAVGPTLAQFGVSPVSAKPMLNLFSGTGTAQIASAQPWGSVTGYDARAVGWIFAIAGAFPLEAGSSDVVYFGLLSPGAYTAQLGDSTAAATGASALTEVYILPYSG